jgi:hypothetical protein
MRASGITMNRKPLGTRSDSTNQDPVFDRESGAGNWERRSQDINVMAACRERERKISDVSLLSADIGWIKLGEHQNSQFATSR